ncbi:cytochrome c biogenesis CcdA family protein [Candidatus Enterococcus mansonii]|uniref:Cytochrome C biogenesis protein transmembrane domain-containing protein n=1 Tax=Candidatus Enterococcus mansonii TaxID=1834181 RepID=A0A242CIE4_9ENTE|nr:cytochrome c biogenesis CcdA family protein [Enterococcus sp. 4G2_DIV0659]OTO10014.1 hypothetical protein A5880_000697 [Enterococcus sp. 4G2_DIV0659]
MFSFILFLEGVLTFISPCILPLLPVYLTYFLGTNNEKSKMDSLLRIFSFIGGFSFIFIIMGMLASYINQYLILYRTQIQLVTGILVILAGLKMAELIRLPKFPRLFPNIQYSGKFTSYFSLFLFGIIFAIGWSPCLGTFLGTALLIASQHGTAVMGGWLLFIYSMGLALPFILCTLFIDSFKGIFATIKKNYKLINLISGLLLIVVGIFMMTGWINYLQLFVPR